MLLINSSNVIELNPLTNPLTDPVYVNDASVTVTILDSAGAELVGVAWPQALPYVAASDGIYRETFAPFTELKEGETYRLVFNVVGLDGLTLETSKREKAQREITC